ncbi:hypothetical protein ACUND6_04760 [Serratia sp. IR-2025]
MSSTGEIKDEVVVALKERISGPLGYIFFSFAAYNWSWIYFMIFSNKLAENKLSYISSNFPKLSGFGWPILFGIILAVSMPFIKALMLYITAKARNIEDKKNHDIKSYLDNYIEETKLELADKRLELTIKNSKISDLITQRETLDSDIKKNHTTLEELRAEEGHLRTAINDARRVKHELDIFIDEHNVTKQEFEKLRSSLVRKSFELNTFKNFTVEIKSKIEKAINIVNLNRNDTAPFLNESELNTLISGINQDLINIDDGSLTGGSININSSNNSITISNTKNDFNSKEFINLLKSKEIPLSDYKNNPDTTITIQFSRKITNEELREISDLYMKVIRNDIVLN